MNPFVTIPREALAELLRNSGSTLTPEQYAATLYQAHIGGPFRKYRSRAVAAAINKVCILVVAIAAIVLLPVLGFTFENLVITVGLWAVTYFEYRVHKYFGQNDPRAPGLGFLNQGLFAAGILVYCIYSAFAPVHLNSDTFNMVEMNNVIDPTMIKSMQRAFYALIALVAGGSQFGLACYYRAARIGGDAAAPSSLPSVPTQ